MGPPSDDDDEFSGRSSVRQSAELERQIREEFSARRWRWNEGITSSSVGAATLAAVTDPMVLRSIIESLSAVSWRRAAYPLVTPWPVG